MAQPVSSAFSNAQASPANLPAAQVQLALGNYFSAAVYGTAASASSALSADYPPSGANDGDRTDINAGPASGADNGVGQSVWASSGAPSVGSPDVLTFTMTQQRTINQIKLYPMVSGAGAPRSYSISYWNGSAFVAFAASQDRSAGLPTSIPFNSGLTVINFPDITTNIIRFTIFSNFSSGSTFVTEVEAYRLIDITSRVKGVKVSRQRDYKLANPMAATVQLDCVNTDRFFSISHVPTASEVAAGFVNQELKPNLKIIVNFGFNTYAPNAELVPAIVAYLDAITPKPRTRDCRITGRDGMKALINQTDSTNLKTNIEISQAIQYVLNRGNISSLESSLGVTNIVLPYFFTDQEDHLTTIRNLTQASGDALFYFNESGIAVFQFYTGNLPLSFTYPTQAAWATGTLAGNMEINGSNQLQLVVQHTTPLTYQNTQSHTVLIATDNGFAINLFAQSFQLPYDTVLSNVAFSIQYEANGDRTATFSIYADNGGTPGASLYATTVLIPDSGNVLVTRALSFSPNLSLAGGNYWYGLNTGSFTNFQFLGGIVDRAVVSQTPPILSAPYSRTLGQNSNVGQWRALVATNDNNNPVLIWGHYTFLEASGSGTWTSAPLDTGAGTTAFTPLIPTAVANGNTLTYLTQTSSDGIHWSGFTPTAVNGQPLSPTARYIQVQVSMVQNPFIGISAIVLDLEVNWVGGTGTRKYPAAPSSFTFDYNSNLVDVSQELADNLGGDTSIVNDITVHATPLLLLGDDGDTVWQGTIGTPPVNVSAATPLTLAPGGYFFFPYISGGMDTSFMSGTNPLAAVVTQAPGTVVSWRFLKISPTIPVLFLNVIAGGVITDFRLRGKTFSSQNTLQATAATDDSSIQQFGDRKQSITNPWIYSAQLAQAIANNLLSVFSAPFSYIPSFTLQPTFNMQIGDRVTVRDVNLDLDTDYITVGLDTEFQVSGDRASVQTTGKLLAVPAGL